jgi:hypothetical protein
MPHPPLSSPSSLKSLLCWKHSRRVAFCILEFAMSICLHHFVVCDELLKQCRMAAVHKWLSNLAKADAFQL